MEQSPKVDLYLNSQSKVCSPNGAGTTKYPYRKKEINFELYLIPYTKINFMYIINLNIRAKTMIFFVENTG